MLSEGQADSFSFQYTTASRILKRGWIDHVRVTTSGFRCGSFSIYEPGIACWRSKGFIVNHLRLLEKMSRQFQYTNQPSYNKSSVKEFVFYLESFWSRVFSPRISRIARMMRTEHFR